MKRGARAGFTLLEAILSVTFFGALMGAFVMALQSTNAASEQVRSQSRLIQEGLEVLDSVRTRLTRSGWSVDYPAIYDGNEVGIDYPDYAHGVPEDRNGETVPSCDLVYLLPADDDDNDWPDVEDGVTQWEAEPRLFCLVPNDQGTNDFVAWEPDGTRRTLARHVESVTFSNPAMTGYTIPLDCVHLAVTLRSGEGGEASEERFTSIIRLANGGLAP